MNKFIILVLLTFSISIFAQSSGPVDETVESSPIENANTSVPEPEMTDSATGSTIDESVVEGPPADVAVETQTEVAPDVTRPSPLKTTPSLVTETEVDTNKRFNARSNHFLWGFGFEQTKYNVVPKTFEFDGRKDFKNEDIELWGGRLGVGGELYLGLGFITRSMIEGYYAGTLFSRILNGGAEAEDVEFAYTKRTAQIVGVDASQSFGWMFDLKTKNPFMDEWAHLTIETFLEAGVGKAWAYNRTNYSYDTGTAPTAARESYKLTVRDDILNARFGGGFHMASSQGFFLNLKAIINTYDITQRNSKGFIQENGNASTPINDKDKNAKIEPTLTYTLGGGYKF